MRRHRAFALLAEDARRRNVAGDSGGKVKPNEAAPDAIVSLMEAQVACCGTIVTGRSTAQREPICGLRGGDWNEQECSTKAGKVEIGGGSSCSEIDQSRYTG